MDYARGMLIRERMAKQRYVPLQDDTAEHSTVYALEHIAFYLGEIEQHLATIARAFDRNEPYNISQVLQTWGLHLSTIAKKE
jgi:hypothetical protein